MLVVGEVEGETDGAVSIQFSGHLGRPSDL